MREYDFHTHAGEVDFVSGGPPCQPFSIGGKHRGAGDTRNMFPEGAAGDYTYHLATETLSPTYQLREPRKTFRFTVATTF